MEESKERVFVCKFCHKKFPSGKSLGGHIRIHTNENSVDSDSYNGNRMGENTKKNKRSVDQRQMMATKQQLCCRECGKRFISLKALCAHSCHSEREKMLMDNQSDTETSSAPTRKRSKRVMKQSNSEAFSYGSSSSASEIDQEHKDGAFSLMMMSMDSNFKKGHNLVLVNSLAESSDNNSVILETKSSSGEHLKIFNVKNQVLETDKVTVDDHLRSAETNGVIRCDSDSSDSDYYMNGPKKSDSDISVDRSLKYTGFGSGLNNSLNRFRNSKELGSKYELSKRKRNFTSYESGAHSLEADSCAETNNKIHRSSDSKSAMVNKTGSAKKKTKGHECPICFRVFKSGQALGGHKRSHSIGNQEHRIEHQVAQKRNSIDLNLTASDTDE